MHIAASRPLYLSKSSIPAADVARERSIALEQGKGSGKRTTFWPRWLKGGSTSGTLLEQNFAFSEEGHKVNKVLQDVGKKAGVSVEIAGFLVFMVGETAAAGAGAGAS